MGKRGGATVVYINQLANGVITLLIVFTKTKSDNFPTELFVALETGV